MNQPGVHPAEMFEDDPQLAAFAQDLRAAADAVPALAVRDDLAAVLEGTHPPVTPAWLPARRRSRRSVTLRVTIAGAVFGLGVGSLGVAGALPDPVQRGLSHAGEVVGVHLPAPAEDHGPPATNHGQEQRQQELEKHLVRTTPTTARHDDGENDDQSPATTVDANDGHRGSGDDVNDHGEQERQHATTTVDDHHGEDGAHPQPGTTTTVDDHHGDRAGSSNGDGRDSGTGRSLER